MSILLGGPPTRITVAGVEVPINSDFRASIRFELLMQNPAIGEDEQLLQILQIYFPDNLPLIDQLLQAGYADEIIGQITWFYRCGKAEQGGATTVPAPQKEVYSFEHDDGYIFAAFLDQYGIDLNTVQFLHWWKFRALFHSLKPDNEFVKIMGYRTAEITSNMSREQRNAVSRLKRLYALPDLRTAEQKEADFSDALSSLF